MTDQFGVLDVAKILAGDRKVLVAQSYTEAVGIVTGFGLAPLKEAGSAIIDPDARMVHWYWPSTPEENSLATVEGFEPSRQQIQAVEEAAIRAILPLGAGAKYLLWRALPEWSRERNFSTGWPLHQFRMRGSFIWAEEPEPAQPSGDKLQQVAAAVLTVTSNLNGDEALEVARAAIEAMRIPTEKMLGGFASDIDGRGTALAVWEDMIEQALGEF